LRDQAAEMAAENTARKQRGRSFRKGQSGNPRGRPLGARNAATVIAEQLLDGQAEALTRKVIDKAKEGDITALRLCLDRILPPRRERPLQFKIPTLQCAGDAVTAMAALTQAVAKGDITASEAAELSKLVESFVSALEASDFDMRLQALEGGQFGSLARE
jgi:hypothetical protein